MVLQRQLQGEGRQISCETFIPQEQTYILGEWEGGGDRKREGEREGGGEGGEGGRRRGREGERHSPVLHRHGRSKYLQEQHTNCCIFIRNV